jgi:hypothetical protein
MRQKQRFALLKHAGHPIKEDHFDLVIEGFILKGEEQKSLMKFEADKIIRVIEEADYRGNVRERYLTYEGVMDGSRGSVMRIDSGEYSINEQGEFVFEGKQMNGRYTLSLRKLA